MSNWTHVAGIIRVDSIFGQMPNVDRIRSIIGKELDYNSSNDEWDNFDKHLEEYLPCGSEGSLHATIWKNPNKSSVAAYTVSIFGDLRDHDSATDIIKWFRNKTLMLDLASCGVRNACVTASNECFGVKNWTYNENAFRQFFNENNEFAILISDDIGMNIYLENGAIVDFNDTDESNALNYLKNLGYIV